MNFYKWQRRRLNILLDDKGNPIGGKWSFDYLNRNKLDAKPKHEFKGNSLCKYKKEAIIYINKHFPNNYGSLDNFIYPINFEDAKNVLKYFIKYNFNDFGPYEDAILSHNVFLHHSVLSGVLNVGLITDTYVLHKLKSINNAHIKLESYEGFIRQIIGWRNFSYTVYVLYEKILRKKNYFNNKNNINYDKIWQGKTGINYVDDTMTKINNYSYVHHIERLMILGNYLLLLQINPHLVYKLFMEWTIDAYDWVMVYNVYGMSQFVDDKILKRPYICSSNYIKQLSNYKNNDIMDALYFYFIYKKQSKLRKVNNYVINFQINIWNKKTEENKKQIIKIAKQHISYITGRLYKDKLINDPV